MTPERAKVEAQARMLAGFIHGYKGNGTLQEFWDKLTPGEKFMIFHQLHTILNAE